MVFTPRLTSNGINGSPWWYSNNNIYYAAGYGMPNCTCYAYGRFAEIRGAFASLPSGNAGTWYNDANNFQRGSTPQLGSVMCYTSRSGNYAGHVSIVEEIEGGGTALITSNSAYNGTYFWTERVLSSNGYCSSWMTSNRDYYWQGCIYNDAVTTRTASPYVVAAICGCFKRESNVNPGVWESLIPTTWDHQYQGDGIGGYGLGQWTNVGTPYGRCWQLHEWVTSNGYTDGDGNGQLAFMIHEGYWSGSAQTRGSYTSLAEYLASDSTNLADLVWDFLANWEGVPGNAYQERLDAANRFIQFITDHQSDDPNDYQWISSNNYLDWDQMYNNVMCVYYWLSNGTPSPTPPQPVGRRKGLPLWMLLHYGL